MHSRADLPSFQETHWLAALLDHAAREQATAADPLGDVLNTTALQGQFDMAHGKQVELGSKLRFHGGRGEFTFAAYRIVKDNLLQRRTTLGDPNAPEAWDQIGEQSSKGIEFGLGYAFSENLRVDMNAAILKAKYDNFQELVGTTLVSRSGMVPIDVPRQTANASATWRFLPQWQAMVNIRHVGQRYLDTANTRVLPAYTTADASLSWDALSKLRLTFQVFNLADGFYGFGQWSGQPIISRPRTYELSLNYKF